jgi:glycosyltransferase involved in cell wall biosynthesis
VRLVEPALPDRARVLDIQGMLDGLEEIDRQQPVDGWVLRGFDLCTAAAARPAFRGRLWAYLTDIPQRDEDITPESSARIVNIIQSCSIFFCQTLQFEAFVHRHWPMSQSKTRILSPMVPPATRHSRPVRRDQPFRVAYAGKFAPLWGIRELFRSYAALRAQLPDAELHVYGDKIHNPPHDPSYRDEIRARLEGGDGLVWHGAVDRAQLMQALADVDVCWAYRDPQFERSTHELSTKVLEYASIGVPIILARSEPNEAALGVDYPLFADNEADAKRLLADLAVSDTLRRDAVRAYEELAHRHSFAAVAQSLMRQGGLLYGQESS